MMKQRLFLICVLLSMLAACRAQPAQPTATETAAPTPTATSTPVPSPTPTPEATATSVPAEVGPSGFPPDVNPLTGLKVADTSLLERRPLAIKVANLPREYRPQWGLSHADLIFEYYTEEGTTRFIAVFYGQNAEMVGPIRSGRLLDMHIVRGYKAVFAFGGASDYLLQRLYRSEFADRLVVEGPYAPLFRYDPNGVNYLMADTARLSDFITSKGVENGRQNLDGMFFRLVPPEGGQPAERLFARYSAAIYNRWDYDPASGKYLRFSDTDNDTTNGQNEKYALLTDRLNGQPIACENVVVLLVTHDAYSTHPEIWDILLYGSGTAFVFRDGQGYKVRWQRNAPDAVVSLTYDDGTPFPLKPGATWFEVMGAATRITQDDQGWRFVHWMP
jgi:hypothetical protein